MPGGSVMRISNWRRATFVPASGHAGLPLSDVADAQLRLDVLVVRGCLRLRQALMVVVVAVIDDRRPSALWLGVKPRSLIPGTSLMLDSAALASSSRSQRARRCLP